MRSKTTAATFCAVAFALLAFYVIHFFFSEAAGQESNPKIVRPVYSAESSGASGADFSIPNSAAPASFVPILPSETLAAVINIDFDGDSLDDQIAAVYKAGSPFLFIVVGLYNPETNTYDRAAEISTEVTKSRTFSFNGIDITGEHKMALVYQGVTDSGNSVMQIYFCRRKKGGAELQNIGSFTSDGTIFIQQSERSEAYELFRARGNDFPVWVYSSDRTDASAANPAAAVSQIQTEYRWNEEQQKYVQSRSRSVTGSRVAARELERIQSGGVETFAQFLNGLWYKTGAADSRPRYIYFDYGTREVIFVFADTEGVYLWEDSNLMRSGIYLTTINSIIASVQRRFDIMLTGLNEIYVHVHDDVGMLVKENTLWDGSYKKMSLQNTDDGSRKSRADYDFRQNLEAGPFWTDDSGRKYVFADGAYSVSGGGAEDRGVFITETVGISTVVQFRPRSGGGSLQSAYAARFDTIEVTVPPSGKKGAPQTRTAENPDVVIFTPVRIAPDTCYAADGRIITLTRGKETAEEAAAVS